MITTIYDDGVWAEKAYGRFRDVWTTIRVSLNLSVLLLLFDNDNDDNDDDHDDGDYDDCGGDVVLTAVSSNIHF